MPRIIPLQLLKCLKVLLDDNGGILSAGEVKRIAGLMTKYSKKLVSKCIYVQILKCTKTELLGEFMSVGGWTLVYTWLNDAIRAMNWPLVQEILELLLLCPVDVHRLKINSAPKLVKGLCKDGGNEGVRILAKRLVEQWLKVVTENNAQTDAPNSNHPAIATSNQNTCAVPTHAVSAQTQQQDQDAVDASAKSSPNHTPTAAQKKATETGLVYKIILKNGQQVVSKVPKIAQSSESDLKADPIGHAGEVHNQSSFDDVNDSADLVEEAEDVDGDPLGGDEDSKNSQDKTQDGFSDENQTKSFERKSDESEHNKDRRSSKDSKDRDRERKSEKDKKSSSTAHKASSSGHKSSSSSSSRLSSSSKSSSSKSSSHRSSSDKHRTDKDRSSSSNSSRDKDRSKEGSSTSSSSSSKHKSSSSSSSSAAATKGSSSSSSSSKDRHRSEKDKLNSSTSSSTSVSKKDKEKELQAEKDKDTLAKITSPSLDKLGKIPKKSAAVGKEDSEAASETQKPTSITIPSKKASISIEIRRDSDKAKTVKTYKSQFRSHGLNEEAPPPPSRKGLKKPGSTTPAPGTVIPSSLPSSLKRPSPPPRDSPTEKKPKIDMNNVTGANEKPGAIKLIAPKKMQTLIETNLFSEALSAATGPKKTVKRKRPTSGPGSSKADGASPPTSPDAPKVAPLKFYQDTLDESKGEEKSDKENEDNTNEAKDGSSGDHLEADGSGTAADEEDDDLPLKRVKEDIEQKVLKEKKSSLAADGAAIDLAGSDSEEAASGGEKKEAAGAADDDEESTAAEDAKKPPGPGCGPDGPPGVLMLHRRKGPKKKLTWRPQEQLEEVRFFELDETERVNVTKTPSSFNDMKNLERFGERDAINIARRGFNHEDNMEPQTPWRAMIEVDEVPPHPDGCQSKERDVQAKRELTTLRALYFSHAMIPDSPAEAELEPHFAYDVPIIPLDDLTGNPDAVNDFTSMPWPEPRGSPKLGENAFAGTGGLTGLGATVDMFGVVPGVVPGAHPPAGVGANPFGPFLSPFNAAPNIPPPQQQQQISMVPKPGVGPVPPGIWQGPPGAGGGPPQCMLGPGFNGSPNIDMVGPLGPMNGPPPQSFMAQYGAPAGGGPQYIGNAGGGGGSPFSPFNGPNFGPMGPGVGGPGGGPMIPNGGMGMMNGPPGPRNNNNNNNRNNGGGGGGGGWRSGGPNYQENKGGPGGGGGGGGGSGWRPAGPGPNRGNMGNNLGCNNNGVCKAFMRGHCRLGKACKFIHPTKNKRV